MDKLSEIDQKIKEMLDEARKLTIGKDVILKVGKYKGRRAKITSAIINSDGIHCVAQPYRKDEKGHTGRTPDLLWAQPEARTYRHHLGLEFLDDTTTST